MAGDGVPGQRGRGTVAPECSLKFWRARSADLRENSPKMHDAKQHFARLRHFATRRTPSGVKLRALALGAAALATTAAATLTDRPIDRATAVRPTAVRDFPDASGRQLATLPAGASVDVFERSRLWLRVTPPAGSPSSAAWLQITDVRLGGLPAPTAAAGAAPREGGAFSAFSRSVSGLLAGFQARRQSGYAGSNAQIGIRGLTAAELATAAPNYQAFAELERHGVMPAAAQRFAFAAGLVPQRIQYVGAAPRAGSER